MDSSTPQGRADRRHVRREADEYWQLLKEANEKMLYCARCEQFLKNAPPPDAKA
jgi:hypothetical protein